MNERTTHWHGTRSVPGPVDPDGCCAGEPTPREAGETYYRAFGWSGCAGSAWSTLPPAARDGWRHAEQLTERVAARERAAVAKALRDAADDIEAQSGPATDFRGNRFAIVGSPWLRARADRLDPTPAPSGHATEGDDQ